MSLILMALVQSASLVGAPELRDFDLARVSPAPRSERCDPRGAQPGDILVCAPRAIGEGAPPDPQFEARPIRAEIGIAGDVRGSVYLESIEFPNGMISKRIMVGIKLPF